MPDDLREPYLRALLLLRDMFEALALDHLEDAPATVPLAIPVDELLAWRTRAAALPLDEAGQASTSSHATDGAALIAVERRRQIEVEGFTVESDARHTDGELIHAAGVYLRMLDVSRWPWAGGAPVFDELDDVPQLVKAGALIAAQIDHLRSLGTRPPMVGDYLTTREQLEAARQHDGVLITGNRTDVGPVLYVSSGGSWFEPGSSRPALLVCSSGWTVERVPAAS